MDTKSKVLGLLEKNRGFNLSGEDIAAEIGVSRTSVWKSIKALQSAGHHINASTNKGYCLSKNSDVITAIGLSPFLENKECLDKIYIYKTIESTNLLAKEMALAGHGHGTIIISDAQTAGRGRYGRSFHSPCATGLYISFILKNPEFCNSSSTIITAVAAVATSKAIEKIYGKTPSIKWVNDILIDGKKVCGILTEAVTDFESGNRDWVIIGIGVNITTKTQDFPEHIQPIATSIFPDGVAEPWVSRQVFCAEIINNILSMDVRPWHKDSPMFHEYKNRLTILGKDIIVRQAQGVLEEGYLAKAIDINLGGSLVVEKDTGERVTLSSGEISIKGI